MKEVKYNLAAMAIQKYPNFFQGVVYTGEKKNQKNSSASHAFFVLNTMQNRKNIVVPAGAKVKSEKNLLGRPSESEK